MSIVDVHMAQTQLSRLIERARAGEEIILAHDGEPAARLVAIHSVQSRRQFGSLKGEVKVTDEFFESLPDEELDAWGQ
jgi:antitoxin (DNA-binding transcriptional repressor) of toxin-antitoxin stability system